MYYLLCLYQKYGQLDSGFYGQHRIFCINISQIDNISMKKCKERVKDYRKEAYKCNEYTTVVNVISY